LYGAAGAAQVEQVECDEQDEQEEEQDLQPLLHRAETVSALVKQTMAVTAPNSSNFRILSSFIERCNGKPPLVHVDKRNTPCILSILPNLTIMTFVGY
jgi:hypothetical protein